MYRTPAVIGKISPDRENRTQTRGGGLFRPEGAYFNLQNSP